MWGGALRAIDRFAPLGLLLPQNFQLVDTTGQKMQLLYDSPTPLDEPHSAQMLRRTSSRPSTSTSPRAWTR